MSWSLFTLDSLIENWGKDLLINKISNEGDYDSLGIYQVPDEVWVEDFGVLAVNTNKTLMPADTGAYTSSNMYYITRTNIQIGTWVKDGEKIYKIHERGDFSFFDQSNLYVYVVKLEEGRLDNSDV